MSVFTHPCNRFRSHRQKSEAYRDIKLKQKSRLDRFPAGHLKCLGYGDLVQILLVQRSIDLKKRYVSCTLKKMQRLTELSF